MTNSNSNNKNNEATEAISISKAKAKEADISYPEITLTKLAFGSCHKNKAALKVNHENIWPSITNVNPQTFLWLGDAVYSPSKNQSIASIETLRREYDDLVFNSTFGYKDFLQSNEDSSSNSSSSSSNARNKLNSLNLIHGTHDDHDYGANDFGKQMPEKQSRKELFLNFLRSSNDQLFINSSGNDNTKTNSKNDDVTTSNAINDSKYLALKSKIMHRDGLYSSIEYGTYPHKVKIILLDTRSNRDYHCPIPSIGAIKLPLHLGSPLACITRWIVAGLNLLNSNNRFLKDLCKNVKMLSKDQWTWLEEQLGVLDNDIDNDYGNKRNHDDVDVDDDDDVDDDVALYIIGSSIQVLTTNPAIESWGHYPEERMRLLKLLNNVGMKRRNEKYLTKGPTTGVVILSGDVHHAEILDSSSGMKLNVDNHGQHWKEGDGKIIEVTSSGLTHSCVEPFYGPLCGPILDTFPNHRYKSTTNYYTGRNFGSLRIQWNDESDTNSNGNDNDLGQNASIQTSSQSMMEINVHNVNGGKVLSTGLQPLSTFSSYMTEEQMQNIISVSDGHLIPYMKKCTIILLFTLLIFQWNRRRHCRHSQGLDDRTSNTGNFDVKISSCERKKEN